MSALLLGTCNWASFGDDDSHVVGDAGPDGDADGDADVAVLCRERLCLLGGGIRTLAGPALHVAERQVHSAGLEDLGRSCAGPVCVEGGLRP